MIDLKRDNGMFQVHPESQPIYTGTPGKDSKEFTVEFKDEWFKSTGIIEDTDKFPALLKEDGSLELITNMIEDKNKITILSDQKISDQYSPWKEYNDSMENYIQLMDTFLDRKQKRKLSRYKGFKSFSDRIYGK